MILSCQNISKSFGTDEILKNVSFHIEANEKAAIVGINGAGKSTLLKIIMQKETPDTGEVILAKDATIGYLAQYQDVSGHRTIYEEVLDAKQNIIEMGGAPPWNGDADEYAYRAGTGDASGRLSPVKP